jgi:hypothetical protein
MPADHEVVADDERILLRQVTGRDRVVALPQLVGIGRHISSTDSAGRTVLLLRIFTPSR